LFISLCTKHLYPDQLSGDAQLALPNMVLVHTALPIQILFFGSLLSAIMSTTSSAILAPASILSENLVKPLSGNRFSDKQLLIVTKVSVLIFSGLGTTMACLRSNIYELVGESSILSLVSLFIPLVFGLYWNKANPVGALLSILMGITSWLCFENFPLAIPSLVPAVLISGVGMIVGSLFFNAPKGVNKSA
jgi:Na+/proline symporter